MYMTEMFFFVFLCLELDGTHEHQQLQQRYPFSLTLHLILHNPWKTVEESNSGHTLTQLQGTTNCCLWLLLCNWLQTRQQRSVSFGRSIGPVYAPFKIQKNHVNFHYHKLYKIPVVSNQLHATKHLSEM